MVLEDTLPDIRGVSCVDQVNTIYSLDQTTLARYAKFQGVSVYDSATLIGLQFFDIY